MLKYFVLTALLVLGMTGSSSAIALNSSASPVATRPSAPQISMPFASLKPELARIARALEAANSKKPPIDDSARRSADAAERADTWAAIMALVAIAETLLTALGVVLVWQTLNASREAGREAKRAADAAEKSVKVTRNIGRAQVRAYVSIQAVNIVFSGNWVPGEAFPNLTISAQNSGQSPARNFVWRPTLQYISGNQKRQRDLGDQWVGTPGVSIPAVGDPFTDSVLIADMGMVKFSKTNMSPSGDVLVRARIEYSYVDVFEKTIEGEVFFSGLTSRVDGAPENAWKSITLSALPLVSDWDNPGPFNIQ